MSDALARTLEARSVALVGASARPGSLGRRMVTEAMRSPGVERVHLVNPSYSEVAGLPCVPDLNALDDAPDLVLLGVGDARLVDQLTAPVRFTQAAGELVRGGVTTFVEIGPGSVLSGLVKRIDRSVRTISVNDLASLEKARETLTAS